MNREIKFRYWDMSGKKMVYFSLEEAGKIPVKILKIYPIMQFTGLLDKNGKEIYEGDICKQPNGKIIQAGMGTAYVDYVNPDFEIIGNIYENPELLGKKENI